MPHRCRRLLASSIGLTGRGARRHRRAFLEKCCRSSVVERILGKAEVVSSILTGSTISACSRKRSAASGVAVPHRLFAKRAFNAAGDHVADPNDRAEQDDGENELQSDNHETTP